MEKILSEAMNIITWAGAAKSEYILALEDSKNKNFENAKIRIENGDEYFKKAHEHHFNLITMEANNELEQITLLLMHAEDQLMNADMVKLLVSELITIYERGFINE